MELNLERVRRNVSQATTEDLLDRVTVYSAGMEPAALAIIDQELAGRGVGSDEIEAHARQREQVIILLPDGTAMKCNFCHRPAETQGWGWHWLRGKLPVFPRYYAYCSQHRPDRQAKPTDEAAGGERPE